MIESFGDLWEVEADLRVITTNGFVKKDGSAVMGRGCAKEAKDKFSGIEYALGKYIKKFGNRPFLFDKQNIASLPVKHNWWEEADIELIEKSIKELVDLVDHYGFEKVAIPRPGCGNGGLEWSEVKEVIEPYLDDRFTIVHKDGV